ncbi:MbtH family protein [Streptomyces sp. NPDC020681]|uniref:MbtH family protein n=1 Tax=Streptomyces sp. NPDC020681 TaxID=3365083 RepID=UPI0037AD53B3
MSETQEIQQFHVVVNGEEQYSIWAADRALPAGWNLGGLTGTREACLEHIEQVWTDMRPLSVRRHAEAAAR